MPQGLVDLTVADGLDMPTGIAFTPDGRLFFVEQTSARVRVLVPRATWPWYQLGAVDPVATVPDVDITGNEEGLLGIAVDPGWPAKPYIYVHYDYALTPNIRISRFTVAGEVGDPEGDSLVVDASSRYDILTDLPDNEEHHNGGTVRFGTDGKLFVSLGDDQIDPCSAQDTTSLRGCILRLDVSGLPPGPGGPPAKSAITPADNPFVTHPNADARLVYAMGLRNPFRFHVDSATGDLLVADVGLDRYEEVDWVTTGGLNFGWPLLEGPAGTGLNTCYGLPRPPFTAPIHYYDRTGFPASIISGGVFHAPPTANTLQLPATYEGDYFYADYYQGWVRRLRNTGGTWAPAPAVPGQPSADDWAVSLVTIVDFAVGPEGGLWYARQFSAGFQPGEIHRVVSSTGVGVPVRTPAGGILAVGQPRPNPASFTATLAFTLGRDADVYATVRDISGRLVRSLLAGTALDAGPQSITWDGRDAGGRRMASGLYLIEVEALGVRASRRLTIVH